MKLSGEYPLVKLADEKMMRQAGGKFCCFIVSYCICFASFRRLGLKKKQRFKDL